MNMEEFDYGIVEIHNRLNINKPLNFETIKLEKCIRFGLVSKSCMSGGSYWEIQILYKDENNELQCAKYNLNMKHINILHQGNMQIEI